MARSRPDGLTVDAEDCVWAAAWRRCVPAVGPDGTFIGRIEVPVSRVSSAPSAATT